MYKYTQDGALWRAGYTNEALRRARYTYEALREHFTQTQSCGEQVTLSVSTVVHGLPSWLDMFPLWNYKIIFMDQCYHSLAFGTGAISRLLALLLDSHWDIPASFVRTWPVRLK